jgi:hypothetical protein
VTEIKEGISGFNTEQNATMLALLAELRYPIGPDGTAVGLIDVLDAIRPIIAYHLTRCGWRPDLSKRTIKVRKVYGEGRFEDAVTWVPMSAPDDPLANLPNMTMAQIEALEPEDVKLEAKRRLGLPTPGYEPPKGWHTHTNISITDEPDPED